jgi:hypothetical protein
MTDYATRFPIFDEYVRAHIDYKSFGGSLFDPTPYPRVLDYILRSKDREEQDKILDLYSRATLYSESPLNRLADYNWYDEDDPVHDLFKFFARKYDLDRD